MTTASLSEVRKELRSLPADQVKELVMRLARYKKENKELLTYLLFEAQDEHAYIRDIKSGMDQQFTEINEDSIYYVKKSIRKILRTTNKFIKYSGLKTTEAELLIYFCYQLKESGIRFRSNTTLSNLYDRQIARILKAVKTLHEDLQHDYAEAISTLK